jgi:thymidylate synthase ThyX
MGEHFSDDERRALAPYFTNLDGPVFALTGLPEAVKGALFARYSRSAKTLRRLFLDEFTDRTVAPSRDLDAATGAAHAPTATRPAAAEPSAGRRPGASRAVTRASELYDRVFVEYGDDSVAQLGGVHLACEGASNVLTKVLEWGRLMAYLEQSTRYVPYDDRPDGRYRYHVPAELTGELRARFVRVLDRAFDTYRAWLPRMVEHYATRHPPVAGEAERAHRAAVRAKALDTLRGLLPAATTSNVGIYATGQAYEQLLLRMRAHPLAEVRWYAGEMLRELRAVIPAFLTRVDLPERGGAWSAYLDATRQATTRVADRLVGGVRPEGREAVTLTDFDPDGEVKVVAAALYASTSLADDQLLDLARGMSVEDRRAVLEAYVGARVNRRHKPGRAFERTGYRFDILADYGAFRDLQRHRMLTIEWQPLSPRFGYVTPEGVDDAGAGGDWELVMGASAELHDAIVGAGLPEVAPYAVAMAYRIRFCMQMSAREAMHLIELRSAPQGHPAYRRVAQAMHRLIAEQARHRAIAGAMRFADHSAVALERLEAERAAERRRG